MKYLTQLVEHTDGVDDGGATFAEGVSGLEGGFKAKRKSNS